jgi:hypothetical protein
MVPCREAPAAGIARTWWNDLFDGANWWQPDEDAAVELIRRAIEGRDAPKSPARDRIVQHFTWETATDKLVEILDEAEARWG